MDELHDTLFAYPGQRKYPLHTKEAALNSFKAFVLEKEAYAKDLRSDIIASFSKAAAYYGLKLRKLAECEEECCDAEDKDDKKCSGEECTKEECKECSEEKCDKEECKDEECSEEGCEAEDEADEDEDEDEDDEKCDNEECFDDDDPEEAPVADVVLYSDNGETMRCSKIDSPEAVTSAIEQLKQMSELMPAPMCMALAEYILTAANELDVEVPEEDQQLLEETAGAGVGDKETIHDELLKRASLIEMDRKSHDALYKYAAELEAMPDTEFLKRETLSKMCSLLTDIDNNFQLTGYYGKKLTAPRKACYSDTASTLLKEASDLLFLPEMGAVLSKKALLERTDRINLFFKEKFGDTNAVEGGKLLIKVANTHGNVLKSLLSDIM